MSNLAPLTETDVRDLAVEFYRLVDGHAPVEEFIPILSEENLKIVLPNVEITSIEEFRAWHGRMIRGFFDGSHTIYDVEVVSATDEEVKAKVVLIWNARVWDPPSPKSEPISMLTYASYVIRRSPKTQKPVVVTYCLDAVKHAVGSLSRTPE
jgi:hypothetical protein